MGEIGQGCLAQAHRHAFPETLPGRTKRAQPIRNHAGEVAVAGVETGVWQGCQPTASHQVVQVHQPGAAGKGRRALVGRMTGAGGSQRQDLPERLARQRQPVQEMQGSDAHVAAAMAPRQAGQVQQYTTGAA
jgi:hypothetical protein